jgi:hypothetical protein
MDFKEKIIQLAQKKKELRSRDIVEEYNVSRQYVGRFLKELVQENKLIKFGSTLKSFYLLPENAKTFGDRVVKKLKNKELEEYEVLKSIERKTPMLSFLTDNVRSIFDYAFSEMLNNAIEHSKSSNIEMKIIKNENLTFSIRDFGIGVFQSILTKKKLKNELEAIQELLKGKTTTAPKAHSGEGIFFTSKMADVFYLESYNYRLTIDNLLEDVFLEEIKPSKKGTHVYFQINLKSQKHLNDIFEQYQSDREEMAFDKTEIYVKLYTHGTVHVSRSQARRLLANLEKFKVVVLDFDKVPNVGQAFADEIFRVFPKKYPDTKMHPINMNTTVEFMVKRAIQTKR